MRRKSTHSAEPREGKKTPRSIDRHRKLDIIGLLLLLSAVFLLLAIVSYSATDESVADIGIMEYIRLFGGDPEIQARADITTNWLGLFGALLAKFFILSTIGYLSLVFPLLLAVWGVSIFRKKDLRTLAYYTNYTLALAFLLATFVGLLRVVPWFPEIPTTWSGNIGDFCAGLISRLIGTSGGILAILATLIILAVIVIDFDIHASARRVVQFFRWIAGKIRSLRSDIEVPEEEMREAAPAPMVPPTEPPHTAVDRRKPIPAAKSAAEAAVLPLVAPRTVISISRMDEAAAVSEAADFAPPFSNGIRSNGVIPKESIAGLSEILGQEQSTDAHPTEAPTSAAPLSAVAQSGVPSAATPPPAKRDLSGARGVTGPASAAADPIGPAPGMSISELERRAVQQAVVGTLLHGQADMDSEAVNQRMASVRLQYSPPSAELLDPSARGNSISDRELRMKGDLVKEKLAVFGIGITSISVKPGPVVTLFELVPDSSVKISKITALSDDLALALAARGIRIIAPIPGKSAVGIEIPNNSPEIVHFRSVVTSETFQHVRSHLPLGLGKAINGEVCCDDLARMPHLLIAGATGAGKSVGVNVMVMSLVYKLHPSDVKFVMIDPKKIELAQYSGLANHFLAQCPDIDETIITDPANAVIVLKSLELEMDKRYTKLAKAGVRHVNDYNTKVKAGQVKPAEGMQHYRLPYIVVVIDELADLMITAAREVEEPIARLAQLARAVGIHLIVATQRPSVDVLTGVIKANFSARIAYQVASRIDSRTILDGSGADQLLGNGDMLYLPSGSPKPVRIQNAFLSTVEVERIVEHISEQEGYAQPYLLPSIRLAKRNHSREDSLDSDELLREAARLVVRHQQGSVSLLQRRLKIGYSRAARIVDQLEIAGVVGSYDGSKAREVLVEDEQHLEELLLTME